MIGRLVEFLIHLFVEAKDHIVADFVLQVLFIPPIALCYTYYHVCLGYGGNVPGSQERALYDNLRKSLGRDIAHNGGLETYARVLQVALDWLDSVFGDNPKAPKDNFGTRLFGLTESTNVWTAASLDRCLLYALIYPLVMVYFIWAVTGDGGAAGTAVFLPMTADIWERAPLVSAIVLEIVSLWMAVRSERWKRVAWVAVAAAVAAAITFAVVFSFTFALAFAFAVIFASAVAFAVSFILASAFAGAFAGSVAGAVAFAFGGAAAGTGAGPGAGAFVGAFSGAGIVAIVVSITVAVIGARRRMVTSLKNITVRRDRKYIYLPLFIGTMTVLCFVIVWLLAPRVSPDDWKTVGAFLLFFGILPLLNAPFDFLSLGLTRGFLRRGLRVGGFSLIRYAIIDVIVALAIIIVLAAVLMIAIQIFSNLELREGQVPTLDLQNILDSVQRDPLAAENWWIYALLLTTQAPSLFNLSVGSVSLIRRIRWLAYLILRNLPDGQPVVGANRVWLAPLLIARLVLPAVVGVVVGIALIFGAFAWLLPTIDFNILNVAKWLTTWLAPPL